MSLAWRYTPAESDPWARHGPWQNPQSDAAFKTHGEHNTCNALAKVMVLDAIPYLKKHHDMIHIDAPWAAWCNRSSQRFFSFLPLLSCASQSGAPSLDSRAPLRFRGLVVVQASSSTQAWPACQASMVMNCLTIQRMLMYCVPC